jgi:hypothetical protein
MYNNVRVLLVPEGISVEACRSDSTKYHGNSFLLRKLMAVRESKINYWVLLLVVTRNISTIFIWFGAL